VSSIEVTAPDVALPYRKPSTTANYFNWHPTRECLYYPPCMFYFLRSVYVFHPLPG